MSELSEACFLILLQPQLLKHWQILNVAHLQDFLGTTYLLPPEVMQHCCATASIDNNALALQRLRRYMLQNNSQDFFNAIVQYCQRQCNQLSLVVVDLENAEAGDGGGMVQDIFHDGFTAEQVDRLKSSTAWETFTTTVDISWLAANNDGEFLLHSLDLSAQDIDLLSSLKDNTYAVRMWRDKLLEKNSRTVLHKWTDYCKSLQESYQACVEFMTPVEMHLIPEEPSADFLLMKNHLEDLKSSIAGLSGDFEGQIQQLMHTEDPVISMADLIQEVQEKFLLIVRQVELLDARIIESSSVKTAVQS